MIIKRLCRSDEYFTQGREYLVRDRYIEVEQCGERRHKWEEHHIRLLLKDDRGQIFKLGQYSYNTEDFFYGKNFWKNWEVVNNSMDGYTFKGKPLAGKSDAFWDDYLGVVCGLLTFGVVGLICVGIAYSGG